VYEFLAITPRQLFGGVSQKPNDRRTGIKEVHPGFLWVIFVRTITYRERNGTVNHGVSSIAGGYKSRPPQ
jgi:hypothetical protein